MKTQPTKLPMQFRTAMLTREGFDKEKRSFALSFSSEAPVERFFGKEILDHGKGSMRMDRLKNGAAVLLNHRAEQLVGVVETAELGSDRVGRATVRLGRSALAEQAMQDVEDGILRNVSVGYVVHRFKLDSSDDKEGDTYRAVDWEPVEISLVAVPADPTVGVGREVSKEFPVEFEKREIENPAAAVEDKNKMATVTIDLAQAERARVREVYALAARYPQIMTREQTEKFANEEKEGAPVHSIADVRKFIMDAQIEDAKKNEVRNLNLAELTEKEKKEYSFVRLMNSAEGDSNCFEREVSETLRKQFPTRKGGFLIPLDLPCIKRDVTRAQAFERVGLVTTSATAGGNVVFTEFISLIEFLYNRMKVMGLGATKLSGLRETVAFPRQSATGAATWVAENPGSDVSDSDITFAQITLSPKMLQASTSYSRKLLSQASIDVEAVVRAELMQRNALALDLAAINGLGSSNQPKGILNQAGIGSVVTGGAALINDFFVDLEKVIAAANADESNMAHLTTPEVRASLKKRPKLQNTAALPIWADNNTVNGYRAEVSNQVPKTLGGGAAHGIVFGDWSQLLIGDWGVMEIIVDPYRLKKQGMIEVTSYTQMDCNVRHVESFAAITDADPNAA
jgi:HK97 family phage major capsid protein/HK97 family phage prohead protease